MASGSIKLDCLDPGSIDKAIKAAKALRAEVTGPKLAKVVTELAREGAARATTEFAGAYYDGENDVTVDDPVASLTQTATKATCRVTARGDSVLFIEFGTGILHPDNLMVRAMLESESGVVGRGEYGKHKGRRRTWAFYDSDEELVFTHGNPSNACLYEARKHVESKIGQVVEEVYKR